MGLNRSHREYMHKVHQEIYGRSNPWIGKAMKPEKKGALHKELKIPEDKKIPEKVLEKTEKSKDITLKKRATVAQTLKSFKKK